MAEKACPYCGNNPVPHFTYWYFETLDVLLAPLRRFLLYNKVSKSLAKIWSGTNGSLIFAKFFLALKIINLNTEVKDCRVRRAQVLWEEAEKRGILMSELKFFGKGIDVYLAKKDKREIIFSGLPRKKFGRALDEMDDKIKLKQILVKAGLPVPQGGSAKTWHEAKKIFLKINKPVIVKPRSGSRGRHTTTFVFTLPELKQAFYAAKQLCFWAVVEEQILGPVYRATVIGGSLAGVLRGDSPEVLGDGQTSLEKLIERKNNQPHPGVKNILVDASMEKFLKRQGLNLTSVLEKDRKINLSEKIGVNYGGSSSEDYEICHNDNKELFLRAAEVLGESIVGFDFIIPDITLSWQKQKCGFIEANSLPFINLHHDPLLGAPRNAAALVWEGIGW